MVLEDRWLRETYVDLLIEYAAKNKDIVILEADLMKAGGTFRFAEKYPERTFDVGIQEANMIGTAAGMSAMGKIPFTHTFTAFATRRVCDQVTLSVAYAGLNVKMMGSDPGVTAEYNGGTHMSMEDVSIMRNIPGMIVYEPVDSAQLKAIFPQIVDHYGPVYIRLLRRNAVKVFEDGETFELGKGKLMREGSDVSIFATGIMVADAVEAVEELEKEGVIESVPGRGFYVCEQKNDHLRETQMMNIESRMSDLLAECENAGMTIDDVIDMVRVLGENNG